MTARGARLRPGAVVTLALMGVAVVVVTVGVLPLADAEALAARTAPVLGFVIAITVVAELARDAAVFDVVAQHLARWGCGRVIVLWAAVLLLAVVSTVFLSLDTTAVIVTPVVVLLAQAVGVPPLPFALATVWLANTGSLLLPVSNLTNLLAASRIGADPVAFLALSWAPALAGVLVPVVILTVAHRRTLFGRYRAPASARPADRVLLLASAVVLVALLPLLALVRDVWIPAAAAAAILLVLFAARRRQALRPSLVPWQEMGLAAALFVIVEAAHVRGLAALLAPLTATGHGPLELLRVAGIGALTANGIDNLPAYLVLEPIAAHDPVALMALLIGVNLGPLVTPWASLAILLWHHRISALGVSVRWGRFAVWGVGAATATVLAAVLALAAAA